MSLEELIGHMRTEEANRLKDKLSNISLNASNANLIESSGTENDNKYKGKDKKNNNFKNYGKGKGKLGVSKMMESSRKSRLSAMYVGKLVTKLINVMKEKIKVLN